MTTLRIPTRFQGLEGIAQGGYLGGRLAGMLGADTTRVGYRFPAPLDRDLQVEALDGRLRLWCEDDVVAEAEPADLEAAPPPPVTREEAEAARLLAEADYPEQLGSCFSCGLGSDGLGIHAGPAGDGRFATPYTPPPWTADDAGLVDLPALWAPLDCAAGWRVSFGGDGRPALTGWLAVEVAAPTRPGEELVVVSDADPGWDGRKRRARSALYDTGGGLRARAESLWISVPEWGHR